MVWTGRALEGDPDLYVSQKHKHPTKEQHTWQSNADGDDLVNISPSDKGFKQATVFVGVHGHVRSRYRLTARVCVCVR